MKKLLNQCAIWLIIVALLLGSGGSQLLAPTTAHAQVALQVDADEYYEYVDYRLVSQALQKLRTTHQYQDLPIMQILILLGEFGYFDKRTIEDKKKLLNSLVNSTNSNKIAPEAASVILAAEEAAGWPAVKLAKDSQSQSVFAKNSMPAGKQLAATLRGQVGELKEICEEMSAKQMRKKANWHKKPRYLSALYRVWLPENFAQYKNRGEWGFDENSPLTKKLTLTKAEKDLVDENRYIEKLISLCDSIKSLEDITWDTVSWFVPGLVHEKLLMMALGKVATKVGAKVLPHVNKFATRFAEQKAGRAIITFGAKQADGFATRTTRFKAGGRWIVYKLRIGKTFLKSRLTRRAQEVVSKEMEEALTHLAASPYIGKYYTPERIKHILETTEITKLCPNIEGICSLEDKVIKIHDAVAVNPERLKYVLSHESIHTIHSDNVLMRHDGAQFDPVLEGSVEFITRLVSSYRKGLNYEFPTRMVKEIVLIRTRQILKSSPRLSPAAAEKKAIDDYIAMVLETNNLDSFVRKYNNYLGPKKRGGACDNLDLYELFRGSWFDPKGFADKITVCWPT